MAPKWIAAVQIHQSQTKKKQFCTTNHYISSYFPPGVPPPKKKKSWVIFTSSNFRTNKNQWFNKVRANSGPPKNHLHFGGGTRNQPFGCVPGWRLEQEKTQKKLQGFYISHLQPLKIHVGHVLNDKKMAQRLHFWVNILGWFLWKSFQRMGCLPKFLSTPPPTTLPTDICFLSSNDSASHCKGVATRASSARHLLPPKGGSQCSNSCCLGGEFLPVLFWGG